MPEIPFEPQKRKRAPSRQTGCMKLLLIPILLAAACYGGMWVFARQGGKLVMMLDGLPVPRNSQIVKAIYEDREHTFETILYFYPLSPEQLREWYTENHVWMSPGKYWREWSYGDHSEYLDYEDYYGTDPVIWRYRDYRSVLSFIYSLSISLTSSWPRGDERCDHVYVYKNKEAFAKHYPDITLPDSLSAFEVATCWPNIK